MRLPGTSFVHMGRGATVKRRVHLGPGAWQQRRWRLLGSTRTCARLSTSLARLVRLASCLALRQRQGPRPSRALHQSASTYLPLLDHHHLCIDNTEL